MFVGWSGWSSATSSSGRSRRTRSPQRQRRPQRIECVRSQYLSNGAMMKRIVNEIASELMEYHSPAMRGKVKI